VKKTEKGGVAALLYNSDIKIFTQVSRPGKKHKVSLRHDVLMEDLILSSLGQVIAYGIWRLPVSSGAY